MVNTGGGGGNHAKKELLGHPANLRRRIIQRGLGGRFWVMSRSVVRVGRRFSSNCGGHDVPGRAAVLAEMGCCSARLAPKGKAELGLLGERHPCVSDDVVSEMAKNFQDLVE